MDEQMSFEDYKQKVKECLEATISEDSVSELMKRDEEELLRCFNEKWTPAGAAAGIASGLL